MRFLFSLYLLLAPLTFIIGQETAKSQLFTPSIRPSLYIDVFAGPSFRLNPGQDKFSVGYQPHVLSLGKAFQKGASISYKIHRHIFVSLSFNQSSKTSTSTINLGRAENPTYVQLDSEMQYQMAFFELGYNLLSRNNNNSLIPSVGYGISQFIYTETYDTMDEVRIKGASNQIQLKLTSRNRIYKKLFAIGSITYVNALYDGTDKEDSQQLRPNYNEDDSHQVNHFNLNVGLSYTF